MKRKLRCILNIHSWEFLKERVCTIRTGNLLHSYVTKGLAVTLKCTFCGKEKSYLTDGQDSKEIDTHYLEAFFREEEDK